MRKYKTQLAKLFRDWFNNYLTIRVMAEHYGIDEVKMRRFINVGRKLHNGGY